MGSVARCFCVPVPIQPLIVYFEANQPSRIEVLTLPLAIGELRAAKLPLISSVIWMLIGLQQKEAHRQRTSITEIPEKKLEEQHKIKYL